MKKLVKKKKCSKCHKWHLATLEYFYKAKSGKLRADCKKCEIKRTELYQIKNKEKIKKQRKECYKKNKDRINKQSRLWKSNNKRKNKQYQYQYSVENREYFNKKSKEYRERNGEKIRKRDREYQKNRRQNDIEFKLKQNLRNRISKIFRNRKFKKHTHSMKLVGCSIDFFKKYISDKFLYGMIWDNYGFGKEKWSLDHIIPCVIFDLTKEKEQKKCFHYTNLQPMWNKDNWSKGSFYNGKRFRKNNKKKLKFNANK